MYKEKYIDCFTATCTNIWNDGDGAGGVSREWYFDLQYILLGKWRGSKKFKNVDGISRLNFKLM